MPAKKSIKHKISPDSLKPSGKVHGEVKGRNFEMTVTSANPLTHCKNTKNHHYMELPEKYRLPLRIDMTVKIDSPGFYLMFGNGHVLFGTHWSDNRVLDDICEPRGKPRFFNTHLPMNKFCDISVIYDLNEMQILVDNEERYYSQKERYMKSPLLETMNAEGFPVRFSCDKHVLCSIKSINITEYNETAGIIHAENAGQKLPIGQNGNVYPEKPDFNVCIANLPEELRNEITDLDEWLRKLKPMKFKRQIEKHGNKITYVASEHGFSYAIHLSYDVLYHTLQWYIITAGKPNTWHRKDNQMESVLNRLAKDDPNFAGRMFDNLIECVGGYGPGCLARTPYAFDGKKKNTCHGKMRFKMTASDFRDVRRFIDAANSLGKNEK